jgi:hypothetical protein
VSVPGLLQTTSALGLFLFVVSAPVSGQSSANQPSLREGQIVVTAGTSWSGSYAIGDSSAMLRSNAPGSQPGPFTLFATSSTIESLASLEASVGYALTRRLLVEARGSFARPNIAVAISQDPETTAQSIDGEKLHQVIVSGGVVWQLPYSFSTRAVPFVTSGVGYLRQLHEERTLVETGRVFYVGGGARYFIVGGNRIGGSVGLRGDVRANWRSRGIDFENKTRLFPTVSVSVFVGF